MASGTITKKIQSRSVTLTPSQDGNYVCKTGLHLPNILLSITAEGFCTTGYFVYNNEWFCSICNYNLTKITSGTYSATLNFI